MGVGVYAGWAEDGSGRTPLNYNYFLSCLVHRKTVVSRFEFLCPFIEEVLHEEFGEAGTDDVSRPLQGAEVVAHLKGVAEVEVMPLKASEGRHPSGRQVLVLGSCSWMSSILHWGAPSLTACSLSCVLNKMSTNGTTYGR